MEDTRAIFGRGWAFPPAFDENGALMVQDLQDIRESLQILFSTQPGERLLRTDYGCDLQSSIFENMSEDLMAELKTQITDSILRHETRIELSDVHIEPDPKQRHCLRIQVLYRLHGSESLHELNGHLGLMDDTGVVFK